MSNQHTTTGSSPDPAAEVSDRLAIILNEDGTITRLTELLSGYKPATPNPTSSTPVLSKDVPLNPQHNTFLRIYLPRRALDSPSSTKLPLIIYFHGGGFVICSASDELSHDFCDKMAVQIGAIVVSVDYRLAPEHRLPAAYEDAVEALHWIRSSDDEWLRDHGDLSNCFLAGTSAGGNVAYHAGLRVAAAVDDLLPLKIQGLVLQQPFFGGSERTPSELRLVNDRILSLHVNDLLWELSLPIGADRDHEYCNHTVGGESERLSSLGWKVMVTGCDGDPLIDRQMELVKVLENKGVNAIGSFDEGGRHGVQIMDPTQAKAFMETVRKLVRSP